MELEPEPRDDTEVPAATANSPEEISVMLGVGADVPSVRRHHLGGDERIDREAELAHDKADPAAERDSAHANRSRIAEPDDETVPRQRFRHLYRGRSRLDPRRAPG